METFSRKKRKMGLEETGAGIPENNTLVILRRDARLIFEQTPPACVLGPERQKERGAACKSGTSGLKTTNHARHLPQNEVIERENSVRAEHR